MTKTYNEIYIKARRTLKDAGIEAYALEARLIVSQASGKTQDKLMRDLTLYAADGLAEKVDALVARRLTGEPVAYLTQSWEFYGVSIQVNRDVLIPRPDTEVLVRAAIEFFAGRNSHPRILDLCTGSGCIGCALAVHMPAARLVLVDNDPRALAVCRSNIVSYGPRVLCIEADATEKPPVLMGTFDMIVCNAPYIPSDEIMGLDPSVRDYEPIQALDGGADGLDVIRAVIGLWSSILRPGGVMMLEVGEGQADTVCKLMDEAGYERTGALKDTAGTERVCVGVMKK